MPKKVNSTEHKIEMAITRVLNGFIINDRKDELRVATEKTAILNDYIRHELEEALIAVEVGHTLIVECKISARDERGYDKEMAERLDKLKEVPEEFGLPAVDDLPFVTNAVALSDDAGTIDFSKSSLKPKK